MSNKTIKINDAECIFDSSVKMVDNIPFELLLINSNKNKNISIFRFRLLLVILEIMPTHREWFLSIQKHVMQYTYC